MNIKGITVLMILASLTLLTGGCGVEVEDTSLHEKLEPLQPLVGKTYKGVMQSSGSQKQMIDVMKYERALNGQAIRVLHSVNDGEYGGESLIFWDTAQKQITYFYFTSAGYFTRGTYSIKGNQFISHEIVTGTTTDLKEIKSTTELLINGNIEMTSEYLKGTRWESGERILYEESPSAKVIFK